MIEVLSAPVLLKAVDFLFGEATKIIQERRDRRKKQEQSSNLSTDVEEKIISTSVEGRTVDNIVQSKDFALQQKIDERIWLNSEAEVRHLLSLLEVHTRNYYLAKEQYAKWGSALVPPIILTNLTEAEDQTTETIEKLRNSVSKIYGKRVVVPEVEQ